MKTLTEQDLRQLVPAAYANGPSSKASERYAFIPTYPLIDQIRQRGWEPTSAHQSKRTQDKEHAIHKITFRDPNTQVSVGDTVPEITLINSHDLSKMYMLLAGFFRLICSNGMIIGTGIGESRTSRIHLDEANVDIGKNLDDALSKLADSISVIEGWQQVELPWSARQEFAREAIIIKNSGDAIWSKHFNPFEFLVTRREQDKKNDLWTVFNVVQENITKGGVMGVTRETRPITQVRPLIKINQDLWQLAEKYGKLHGRN